MLPAILTTCVIYIYFFICTSQIDPAQFTDGEKLKVKISGDGARMTGLTNFIIMSFSIVENDDAMSSKGILTVVFFHCAKLV